MFAGMLMRLQGCLCNSLQVPKRVVMELSETNVIIKKYGSDEVRTGKISKYTFHVDQCLDQCKCLLCIDSKLKLLRR
jgi:hypothetical protein